VPLHFGQSLADGLGLFRRARHEGLLVRPRYAAGRTDVVTGYSVAERPRKGERAVWFGGNSLGRDLALPNSEPGGKAPPK
jgi:hypothetical protein